MTCLQCSVVPVGLSALLRLLSRLTHCSGSLTIHSCSLWAAHLQGVGRKRLTYYSIVRCAYMVQASSPDAQHVLVGVHSCLQCRHDELWGAVGGDDAEWDDVGSLHKNRHTVDLEVEALGCGTINLECVTAQSIEGCQV
jgi:hypothetical protein